MSQQSSSQEPLVGEVRFRVPLPIVIPLVALAVIGVFVVGFAWVLLSIPSEAATVIAIAMAVNVLGVCAYLALRPKVSTTTMFELLAILIYPLLIGVVIANTGFGEETAAAEGEGGAETEVPATGGGTTVVAEQTAFNVSELEIKAGAENTIAFDNKDAGVEHNLSIYPDQEAGLAFEGAIFEGEVITGPDTTEYSFQGPEPGEYHFQCDIHPNMSGTATAK